MAPMSVGTGTVKFFYPTDTGTYDANEGDADHEFTNYKVCDNFAPILHSDLCAHSAVSTGYSLGPYQPHSPSELGCVRLALDD